MNGSMGEKTRDKMPFHSISLASHWLRNIFLCKKFLRKILLQILLNLFIRRINKRNDTFWRLCTAWLPRSSFRLCVAFFVSTPLPVIILQTILFHRPKMIVGRMSTRKIRTSWNLGSRESTTRSLSRESDDSRSCAQMQMFRPNQTDRQTHHEGLNKVFFYRFLIYPIQDSPANEKPRASQDARIVPVRIIIRS